MNNKTQNLAIALNELQSQVIGLFHPRFYPMGEYICVIEDEAGSLTCIEVGDLLGHSTLHIDSTSGRYVKFPSEFEYSGHEGYQNDKLRVQLTLTDMKKDVTKFSKWYDTNIKNI